MRFSVSAPEAPRQPRFHFGPRVLLLGAVLIASFAAFIRPVTDGDFWWHVRTGRWILEHGALPGRDLFTYTVTTHLWIDHEYLTELLMWLLRQRLGLTGVSVGLGVFTWLGFVLVVAASRPRRSPYVMVGLGLALAVVAGSPTWGARPQMVTFALAGLELFWLRRFMEGSGRAIVWLPVITAVWGNLHGGWPVAFLFLGVALVCCFLLWLGDRSNGEHLGRARLLAVVGVVSAASLLVNPNGLAVYTYPLATLTSGAQQGLIAEWQSPDFHLATLRAFELMLLMTTAGLALSRPALFDVLVVLAAAALALQSVRHISLFVVAATPVMISSWSEVWWRLEIPLIRLVPGGPRRRWLAAATIAVLALTAAGVGSRIADDLRRQPELTARTVPVGAADWLAAHPSVGTRMFNQYAWGGYLADRFYPEPNRRLFVFSEGALMGDHLLRSYEQVAEVGRGWQAVLDSAGTDYVVFNSGSALDAALAGGPDWHLVYRDSTAVIYLRST